MGVSDEHNKLIRQLESDLSEFLITEMSPPNPQHRSEAEMYKYKGLMLLSVDPRLKRFDRTFLVRIGTLEAEFSLSTGEKIHGSVGAKEDKLVFKWTTLGDNLKSLQTVYRRIMSMQEEEKQILPFDLGFDDDD